MVKLEELLGVTFPHHQGDTVVTDSEPEASQSNPGNTDLTFTLNAKSPEEVEEKIGTVTYLMHRIYLQISMINLTVYIFWIGCKTVSTIL